MPSIVSIQPAMTSLTVPDSPQPQRGSPNIATRTLSDSGHRTPPKGSSPAPTRDDVIAPPKRVKSQLVISSPGTTPTSGIDVSTPSPMDSGGVVMMMGAAQAQQPPPSPKHSARHHQNSQGSNGTAVGGPSGHERRFRRRFPKVGFDEDLVDHYSCALLSDILLQGVLYISPKFFAFYSNIFGYKTQLLMPLQDVLKITKERTAKIIPNAVGVTMVGNQKYVFGSLLTRDATFKTMFKVWTQVVDPDEVSPVEDSETDNNLSAPNQNGISEDELEGTKVLAPAGAPSSKEGSGTTTPQAFAPNIPVDHPLVLEAMKKEKRRAATCQWLPAKEFFGKVEDACMTLYKLPRTSLMLLISTLLLVVLFASASVVMYRITLVHRRISATERSHPDWVYRWNTYQDIHRKQNQYLNDEVERLTTQLKQTIQHLNQMRLPLEELAVNINKLPDYCAPQTPPGGGVKKHQSSTKDGVTSQDHRGTESNLVPMSTT